MTANVVTHFAFCQASGPVNRHLPGDLIVRTVAYVMRRSEMLPE